MNKKKEYTIEFKKVLKWLSENEYCSGCCSPKKYCRKWGEKPSAIDTDDFRKFLIKENK
jgi:hypothetical protein